jgi:hypothetical protein
MTEERNADPTASSQDPASPRPRSGATHEEILAAHLPPQETDQPDPALQLSVGRLGGGSITLVAILAVIILSVVLYGLNSPTPNDQHAGTPPSASAAAAGGGPGAPNGPQQTRNGGG